MKKLGRPKKELPEIHTSKKFKDGFIGYLCEHPVFVVNDIGVFSVRKVKSRKLYHNFSKKRIVIKGRYKLHFEADPAIKKYINK